MKRGCLMIFFAVAGLMAILLVMGAWVVKSKLTSGYEVTNDTVWYHEFDNLHWKVDRWEVIVADVSTFQQLKNSGGQYGRDKQKVYFHEAPITASDPTTFQVLDWRECLAQDENQVYWRSIAFSDDPQKFQLLSYGYSKDTNHVYYGRQIVENADPGSFVVIGDVTSEAKDKDHEYDMGRIKN